jgi:hypothetical protein
VKLRHTGTKDLSGINKHIDRFLKKKFPNCVYPWVGEREFRRQIFDIEVVGKTEEEKKLNLSEKGGNFNALYNIDDDDDNSNSDEKDTPKPMVNEAIKHVKALLVARLVDPFNNFVNLREFRDLLLGRRAVSPIIISWGMHNGGRLGIDDGSESDCNCNIF